MSQKQLLDSTSEKLYQYTKVGKLERIDIDVVERTIGGFGIWQFQICFLMAVLKVIMTWYDMSIIYLNPATEFVCKSPPLFNDTDNMLWSNHLFNVRDVKIQNSSCAIGIVENSNQYTVPCLWGYKYNTSVIHSSIVTEWNLVCNNKYLANLSQTMLMFGETLGNIGLGFAADKYGRKKMIILSIVMCSLFSALLAIAESYTLYLVYKFLLGLSVGVLGAGAMVLSVEVMGNSYRVAANSMFQGFVGLGYITMAGLAYVFRDWRQLQWAFTFFNVLCISYIYLIDESPRWLILRGDKAKLNRLFGKITKINKTPHSVDLDNLQVTNKLKDRSVGMVSLFKTPLVRKNTLLLSVAWLLLGISFFGIVQYVGQATSDIYLTIVITGVFSIPGSIIAVPLMKVVGRRRVSMYSSLAIPFGYVSLLNVSTTSMKILTSSLIYIIIGICLTSFHLLSNEIYPTVLRNSGAGFCLTFQRLGGTLAPFALTQEFCNPLWIFICVAIMPPILMIPLSETYEKNLYETIEDLEQ